MLVPSMTLEEIRKDIDKDYPILYRKVSYVLHKLEKELSKTMKEKGFTQFYDYFSKYKNHWIYRVRISRKASEFTSILLYHNGRGYAGIAVTSDLGIICHTGHFFERYNERLNLGLKSISDIVYTYI